MKTAGYHCESYGPGKTVHMIGEVGSTGSGGFVYVRKVDGKYVVAKESNKDAVPVELLGREVPCRVILEDAGND